MSFTPMDLIMVPKFAEFPETSIRQIRSCIEKMQNKLAREMMGKLITCEDMDELKRLSEEEPE